MFKVDLNSDLGESFGAYKMGNDQEILKNVTSANVACGFHAGDPAVMRKTVKMAIESGCAIGAHPGMQDLVGFGRRKLEITPDEAYEIVLYQVGALAAFVKAEGGKLQHVKPHGALYNMAAKDYELAKAICQAIKEVDDSLILLALSNSEMLRAAKDTGLSAASEVFADRAYERDGSLVSRSRKGSMIEDETLAVNRVIRMAKEGVVEAIDKSVVSIEADSVCVHGDGVKALEFVKKIRKGLLEEGIEVKGF